MQRSVLLLLAGMVPPLAAGCIPYSTGTTAAPIPPGVLEPSLAVYFVPGGLDPTAGDSTSGSLIGADAEIRYGIDERSDVGVRAPGLLGIVVDYKRRLDGGTTREEPALAALVGGGVVNAGEHALFQAALLASGGQSRRLTPYGGAKLMQVIPLTSYAVEDKPTIGVFGGVRLGSERLGLSPEIGVFYDPSALGLRETNWIVVPSFTFHGQEVLDVLLGRSRGRDDPYPPRPTPVPRPPGGRWP
jgi:hypothetical protein